MGSRGWKRTESLSWAAIALLTVVAAGLRLFNLDSGLWYDEIKTLIDSVRSPLVEIVTHFPSNNDHLFYSVVAHISIESFGEHAWSVRLPAAILGIASVPMLYLLALRVTSRVEALASASVLAISYHHVWFSQNARGYTGLLFCALLSSYLLIVGLQSGKWRAYAGFAVVAALGIYTHLTMAFVIASQFVFVAWHLLRTNGWRIDFDAWKLPALGFVLSGLVTLLLYAPILFEVTSFFKDKAGSNTVATPVWAIWAALREVEIGFVGGWSLAAGGLIFLVGCGSYFRRQPELIALFLLAIPLILAATILLERPIFPRFFFYLAGFFILIVVRGAVSTGALVGARIKFPFVSRLVAISIPGVVVGGIIIQSALSLPYGYKYPKQDYGAALSFVDQSADGDLIAAVGGGAAVPYQRYYEKNWPRVQDVEHLSQLRQQSDRLWLVMTFKSYVQNDQPDLFREIVDNCTAETSFWGTVGGGEINVFSCAGG